MKILVAIFFVMCESAHSTYYPINKPKVWNLFDGGGDAAHSLRYMPTPPFNRLGAHEFDNANGRNFEPLPRTDTTLPRSHQNTPAQFTSTLLPRQGNANGQSLITLIQMGTTSRFNDQDALERSPIALVPIRDDTNTLFPSTLFNNQSSSQASVQTSLHCTPLDTPHLSPSPSESDHMITLWNRTYASDTTRISASDCELSGEIPFEMTHLSNVHAIELSYNRLCGTLPKDFEILPLRLVCLDHNTGLGGALTSFSPNINFVSIRRTNFQHAVLAPTNTLVCTLANSETPLDTLYASCCIAGIGSMIYINADVMHDVHQLGRIQVHNSGSISFCSKSNVPFPKFLTNLGVTPETYIFFNKDGTVTLKRLSPYADFIATAQVFEEGRRLGAQAISEKLEEMEAWGPLLDENDVPLPNAVKRAKAFEALYISDAPRQKSAHSII